MTFYYADGSGSYKLPVHLAANASTMIDIMMLIETQRPDADGHTIPSTVTEGSAIIESSAGRRTPVNVVASGGIFNVQTGTCGETCITCCGYNNFDISPSNFTISIGQGVQCVLSGMDCNGFVQNFAANWSSSDTSAITIDSSGLATAVAGGSSTINGQVSFSIGTVQGQVCGFNPVCPTGQPRSVQ